MNVNKILSEILFTKSLLVEVEGSVQEDYLAAHETYDNEMKENIFVCLCLISTQISLILPDPRIRVLTVANPSIAPSS